jgi:two-component system sensor histidine kinase RegB
MSALKLPWLRRLRWTAVAGQAITVLWVVRGLNIPLPLGPVFAVISFTALTNLGLHGVPAGRGESSRFLAGVLALDVALLTVMLHLTGGPHNPFSTLYLVLVALSAIALTPAWTWAIAGLSCVGYGWLFLAPEALARAGDPACGVGPNLPLAIHLRGMIVAFGVTAVLVAFFAARMQQALRRQDLELAKAREQAIQHERFAALATLAAGAAHELGTPLGTIVVAAGELAREARSQSNGQDYVADAELIRAEAFRCRTILDRLHNNAADVPQRVDLGDVLRTLQERFPEVHFELHESPPRDGLVAPPQALTQALANLIGNAVDAAPAGTVVHVRMLAAGPSVEFQVTDRGAGLSEEARVHASEPFFTTKPPGKGMGLGLFLVQLLARRLAGELRFETPGEGGTRAILRLPVAVGEGQR